MLFGRVLIKSVLYIYCILLINIISIKICFKVQISLPMIFSYPQEQHCSDTTYLKLIVYFTCLYFWHISMVIFSNKLVTIGNIFMNIPVKFYQHLCPRTCRQLLRKFEGCRLALARSSSRQWQPIGICGSPLM